MTYILYNPLAANGHGAEQLPAAHEKFSKETAQELSCIGLDAGKFLDSLTASDRVVLCGGDGTLNRMVNEIGYRELPCDFYLLKAGTGNDFLRDVEDKIEDGLLYLNPYIKDLPEITVNGKTYRYLNGIGYGIDGSACEVADDMRAAGETKIDYAAISVKLLISGFHCPDATVTVDGVTRVFKKAWLASAMNGRYYGGGMIAAPGQDRLSGKVSCMVWHGTGRLLTLMRFTKIFKGEHLKYKKMCEVITGDEITVEFSHPNALQIDGETVRGVSSYTVVSANKVKERLAKAAEKV